MRRPEIDAGNRWPTNASRNTDRTTTAMIGPEERRTPSSTNSSITMAGIRPSRGRSADICDSVGKRNIT